MDTATRPSLTRDRVLDGAVALADDMGIERFTIRRLAEALDVKPMTSSAIWSPRTRRRVCRR